MLSWLAALHIIFVFYAFALTAGVGVVYGAIGRSLDVRAIRAASRIARPLLIAGSGLLVLGIVFGFGTASTARYDLGSHWLLVTYVLVALLLILTGAVHAPFAARLRRAADACPDDQPSPQLRALAEDRLALAAGPLTGIVWLAIIVMMVVKPF